MNIAIGCIEEIRINKRNVVKYLIKFKDDNGRIHQAWSNWTSKKNYELGTSIPIKYRVVPGAFGFVCCIVEIDDLPQFNEKLMYAGAVSLVLSAVAAGYVLAKLLDDNN